MQKEKQIYWMWKGIFMHSKPALTSQIRSFKTAASWFTVAYSPMNEWMDFWTHKRNQENLCDNIMNGVCFQWAYNLIEDKSNW